MPNSINRRDILRLGLTGAAAGGFAALAGPRVFARAGGVCPSGDNKMLMIFLRGGADTLNCVHPTGPDAQVDLGGGVTVYNTYQALRPTIGIEASNGTILPPSFRGQPLVNGAGVAQNFAELHPALAALLPIYQAGDLSLLHRVGYDESSLSHFSAQQFWETGRPQVLSYLEGWVTRWGATGTGGIGVSVSPKPQRLFNTPVVANLQPHVVRLQKGTALNASPYTMKADPAAPTPFEAQLEADLANEATKPTRGFWEGLVRGQSATLSQHLVATDALVTNGYVPTVDCYPVAASTAPVNPTDLPTSGYVTEFGNQLKDAMALLKHTDASIVGVEIGGWDTHSNQGGPMGRQQERLSTLAAGMNAIYKDSCLAGDPSILTLAFTEFGRTSPENQSGGTDHARGGAMFAMGKCLIDTAKQVHNCDADPAGPVWDDQTFTDDPTSSKHMLHQTDFRVVFREALVKHMGFAGNLDDVFLDFSVDDDGSSQFQNLNYLL